MIANIILLNLKIDVVNDWSFDDDVITYSSKMIDVICVLNDYIYAFMFYTANLAFYMFFFKYMHQNILKYVLYKKRSQNEIFSKFRFSLPLPAPNSIASY